jgi:hypothetical protein
LGKWTWLAAFTSGTSVAQDGKGVRAGHFDRATGCFVVESCDKTGADNRRKGRLDFVGEHYYQFVETKQCYFKVGADSPEN